MKIRLRGRILFALACIVVAAVAIAQAPPDIDIDWHMDRGNYGAFFGPGGFNGAPFRLGHNNFTHRDANNAYDNNPGPAFRRWVWPMTRDTAIQQSGNGASITEAIIDNPNPLDPQQPRATPLPGGRNVVEDPKSYWFPNANAWTVPVTQPVNHRTPFGGYSRDRDPDPAKPWNYDYGWVYAAHNDFLVTKPGEQPRPATDTELQQFPNADPDVYRAVHTTLISTAQPTAAWTVGHYIPAGDYAIDLYSPGDGTLIDDGPRVSPTVAHANVRRAFVRVSWQNTVDPNTGDTVANYDTDAVNSRIFVVNLAQTGWIRLTGGGLGPAKFTFDGTVQNELTVTLYTLTPDNTDDTSRYATKPLITADAVRFTPLGFSNRPALGPIAGSGRILGAAAGTNQFSPNTNGRDKPYFYVAREEFVQDPTLRSHRDPTDPKSPPIPDPTALTTSPVFYCIDNQAGNVQDINGNFIRSIDKVIWRYVGLPDGNNGTSSASPLLAQVHCRDGQDRPMIYWVTTSTDGSLGRVYALDPVGDIANRVTTALWIYPSYRPLLGNEPRGAPREFQDPNFTLPGNLARTGYADPANWWAPDQDAVAFPRNGVGRRYYDGDIVRNDAGQLAVRPDTRVTLGGMQSSPIVINDPSRTNTPNAPQLLIVGGMNGRVYAFDAGGRGDLTDANNNVVAGTTQRIWTWPHFAGDMYHTVQDPLKQDPNRGYISANGFKDEASLKSFPASPTYDPTANAANQSILIGAGDGHMYSLDPVHDDIPSPIIINGQLEYGERRKWIYPDAKSTLGAAPSTAALFKPTNGTDKLLYFTCAGRAYCIPASPAQIGTQPVVNTLTWVYPWTPNPPQPDPNDGTTLALDPGFSGTAPLTVAASLREAGGRDSVFLVQNNGVVHALDPLPQGATTKPTLIATGETVTRGATRCSPIGTLINGQAGLDEDPPTANKQALILADDDGSIWAIGMKPVNTGVGGAPLLPILWEYDDSFSSRSASAILARGVLVEGDEGGQLRAYALQAGETVGPGEPLRPNQRGPGAVSIDLRLLDAFEDADYDALGRTRTPAIDANGNFVDGTLMSKSNNLGGKAIGLDWGENLNVVAWGVYYAQSPDPPRNGTAPTIRVTFTVSQTGQPTKTYGPISVTPRNIDGVNWPNDPGMNDGQRAALQIWGLDPGQGQPSLKTFNNNRQGGQGMVLPWVAKTQIKINPEGTAHYVPGNTGIRVTARAEITQTFQDDQPAQQTETRRSNDLALGQKDAKGLGDPGRSTPISPNRKDLLGDSRPLYILHPIGLTVRGHLNNSQDLTGPNSFNVIGWGATVDRMADYKEVLGNGNRRIDVQTALGTIKPLLAPLGMVKDGSSETYGGIDGNGNRAPALFLADRTLLTKNTGATLTVKILPRPLRWHGDATSAMNPLAWEDLPNDARDTQDYPSIGTDSYKITDRFGRDGTRTDLPLIPPRIIPGVVGQPNREIIPTPLSMQVNVPRFQPANVNRGAIVGYRGKNFGSNYRDISGLDRNGIVGPVKLADGNYVALNSPLSYPAGGYLSELIVQAVPPGQVPLLFRPEAAFQDSRSNTDGTYQVNSAYRAFEVGMTVPPTYKMRVQEQTIDFGKLPHGTGVTDFDPTGKIHSVRFSPSGLGPYQNAPSPWDDENQLGVFFRPFTLVNESNVNLFDVRVAKLLGINGALINNATLSSFPPNNVARAARLVSDTVNSLTTLPLFAVPFPGAVAGAQQAPGNLGLVSSFDHVSTNTNLLFEYPLWPVDNKTITAAGVVRTGLDMAAFPWTAGKQQQPTVHKARVRDTQGVVATVPDHPYDYNAAADISPNPLNYQPPKIGITIPLGTPVGTYSNPIYVYEDYTPIQWREWLESSGHQSGASSIGADQDAILNLAQSTGLPSEPFADPTFTLKVTVREDRLTQSTTPGTLAQIDPVYDPKAPAVSPNANLLPAAVRFPDPTRSTDLFLYWTTNRQPGNGTSSVYSPWSILYSNLRSSSGELDFAIKNPQNGITSKWWSRPGAVVGAGTVGLDKLFPSTLAQAQALQAQYGAVPPFNPGTPNPTTERHASPAAALAVNPANASDTEAYLVWQGQIDKNLAGAGGVSQQTETRTFYQSLNGAVPGVPDPNSAIFSFLNDPSLTKLSPKPLLLKLPASGGAPAQKLFYLFWHAGNQGQTSLYYNINATANVTPLGWTRDLKLPAPGALVWQSDPHAVYRRVPRDPNDPNSPIVDAIDVVFTGVLKNRQTVELLLSRYRINRTAPAKQSDPPLGALEVIDLPRVFTEVTTRAGATNSYAARDAAWLVSNPDLEDEANPTTHRAIRIFLNHNNTLMRLNYRADGKPSPGRQDPASGLIYYDVIGRDGNGGVVAPPNNFGGGQMVVDPSSGSISFPNIPPGRNDTVLVSYTPRVMRLSTSRDSTNIDQGVANPFGVFGAQDLAFRSRPAITSSGTNASPVAILDHGYVFRSGSPNELNPRASYAAPKLVYGAGSRVDRMWVLYRKTDVSGGVRSGIYYKAMRLMVRLPRPMQLKPPDQNGQQQLEPFSVAGNIGPYEVDWARGRIYFTEVDEGRQVTVNYTYGRDRSGPILSGNLIYRVAWGDEITPIGRGVPANGANLNAVRVSLADETTPEVLMPTDTNVNEGQVTAFKDPLNDKLWVFWASSRANDVRPGSSVRSGTTDLYYHALSPQFYPVTSNQQ